MNLSDKQIETLKKMVLYFKEQERNDTIVQSWSPISKRKEDCGCFGAHVARFFDHLSLSGQYSYEDGIRLLKELLGFQYECHLEEFLSMNGSPILPFGPEEWDEHPSWVLQRIINESNKQT